MGSAQSRPRVAGSKGSRNNANAITNGRGVSVYRKHPQNQLDYTVHLYQGGLLEQYDGTSSTGATSKYATAIYEVEDRSGLLPEPQDQLDYTNHLTEWGELGKLYEKNTKDGEEQTARPRQLPRGPRR